MWQWHRESTKINKVIALLPTVSDKPVISATGLNWHLKRWVNYFHFGLLSIQNLLKYSTILTYVLGSLKVSTFSVPISDVEILMAEKQILLFFYGCGSK